MRVLKHKTLIEFYTRYPDAKNHLEAWFYEAERASWENHCDIKQLYSSASFVANNRVVFNICGNKYRLIVKVQYKAKIVFIRFIGTHKEYDDIDAENV